MLNKGKATADVNNNPTGRPASTGALSRFILKAIIFGRKPYESKRHLALRRFAQISTATIASAARLAFISPSYEAAGTNHVWGILLSYGNVAAYSVIFSWCTLNLIHHLLAPVLQEEKLINFMVSSKFIKIFLMFMSFTFGFFAQFPIAYLAYTYNHNSLFVGVAVMVSDIWFPVYSTWCGLSKLIIHKRYSKTEKELAKVKQDHINNLKKSQLTLVDFIRRTTEKVTLPNELDELAKSASSPSDMLKILGMYTSIMIGIKTEGAENQGKCSKYIFTFFEKLIFCVSFIFLISRYVLTARVGFEGWRLIWNQLVFDIIMTCIVFLSFLYLLGVSIPNAAVRLFRLTTGIVCCKYEPTLAQASMPKSAVMLTLFALFTTSISWGPAKEFSTDYFTGWSQIAMLATSPAATFLLTTNIALLAVDKILEKLTMHFGSSEAKELMSLNWKYTEYIRILEASSISEYLQFLKEFPIELLNFISPNVHSLLKKLHPDNHQNDPDADEHTCLVHKV